jgi:hypothetical protein
VLGVNPMSPESERAAIAWGGVTPAVSDPQYKMLLFTGDEGAHRGASKDKAPVGAPGKLQLLGAGHADGVTLMLYGVMRTVPAP